MNRDTETNLRDKELEYIELYRRLITENVVDPKRLAGPFMSCAMDGYWKAPLKVMYVGKATHGKWGSDTPSLWEFVFNRSIDPALFLDQTKIRTRELMSYVEEGGNNTAFWRFARNLSQEAYAIRGRTGRPLENLLWTNVAKLGVKQGNPGGQYLRSQVDLARATLKAEVAHYRPDVIIVCTGIYANGEGNSPDIVHSVFGAVDHEEWQKPVGSLWWRQSFMWEFGLPDNNNPNIISITDHPERKATEILEEWISLIVGSW